MKMNKKLLALAIGAFTVVSLAGCQGKEISNDYIKIKQYKGVEVEKVEKIKVTDEDVENAINETLRKNVISTPVTDRAVEDGDVITLDYSGKKDGVEFEGGTATDQSLTIGSKSFIDGFEAGIIGHKIGETFDIPLTFPADYQSTELAGADVVFTITVKTIATEKLPELNDKFVKSVSEKSKTVAEYKKEVKADLEKANKEQEQEALQTAVWAKIIENTKVIKLPKDRKTAVEKQLKQQYEDMAKYYEMTFAQFLESNMGMTEEDFTTQVKSAAENAVKEELAVELIAKKARLEPNKKELEEAYKELAKKYGFEDVAALKKAAKEEELKKMILSERVKEFVAEKSIQVEKPKEEEKATDKKATDKKEETAK